MRAIRNKHATAEIMTTEELNDLIARGAA